MIIVSSREFRANQRKYFNLARADDVVITSRSCGSYRLVPISDKDSVIDEAEFEAKIKRGIAEYEQGKGLKKKDSETMDDFLRRMINED